MLTVVGFLLIIHVFHLFNVFPDEVAPLEVLDYVWFFAVHDEAQLFNRVHPLRGPIVELAVDKGEADHPMSVLMQLRIAFVLEEVGLDALLFVAFFQLVQLILVGHLVNTLPEQVILVLDTVLA